ncbi:MAG: hypothetical protein AAF735_02655 [Myxococcota bacterium]
MPLSAELVDSRSSDRGEPRYVDVGRLTEARMIEIVFPEQTNHYRTLFGGRALHLLNCESTVADKPGLKA